MQSNHQWQLQELAYCSNVHPGSELEQVNQNILNWFNPVRKKRRLNAMASGLWLASAAVRELNNSQNEVLKFRRNLADCKLELTSLNGFPYGNFHQKVVKQKVYLPTWAETERLQYTQQLAQLLATEVSENARQISNHQGKPIRLAAISTLPLAYADGWTADQHQRALSNLIELAQFLKSLEENQQVRVQIGIEMEPDCVLENTQDFIRFFEQDLLPAAANKGLHKTDILNYIGCCFDTCHQAVMHEDIAQSLAIIQTAGIQICKIQISNAISATLSSEQDCLSLCQLFKDEKFLHQCKLKVGDTLLHIDDLAPEPLLTGFNQLSKADEPVICNLHYHVPVHLTELKLNNGLTVNTTQTGILKCLDYLQQHPGFNPYLEIETYTWLQYLTSHNNSQQADLISGLADELNWLAKQMKQRELITESTAQT